MTIMAHNSARKLLLCGGEVELKQASNKPCSYQFIKLIYSETSKIRTVSGSQNNPELRIQLVSHVKQGKRTVMGTYMAAISL